MPPISGQASTATVSAPNGSATSATLRARRTTGMPGDIVQLRAAGQARGDHRQPVIGPPAQLPDQIRDHRRVSDRHHPAHAAALAAHPVQPLAQRVPGQQVEDGQARKGDNDVAAGDGQLGGVGDDRDGRGQAHRAFMTRRNSSEPRPMKRGS